MKESAMFAFMTGVLYCNEIFMKSHSASNTDMPCNVYFEWHCKIVSVTWSFILECNVGNN